MAQRPAFLKSAGSGSESATQIINHLNSLMKKYKGNETNADKLQHAQKILVDNQRTGQFGTQKWNGTNGTVLETEETGFSAIEEEVKSNEMIQRPTVYAGMSAKMDRNVSGGHPGESFEEIPTSLRGGRQNLNDYDMVNPRQIMSQYVDKSIEGNLNQQAQQYIDQFYHSNVTSG